jgi:hypothetical protein
VFTEYRDTLESLRAVTGGDPAVLHGAMDRFERSEAVHRFTSGRARVLLATDAAGEGLNLQARCRLVINLELPWNPMRLEQRIGRVDRIGQARVVHAINLLAAGTAEAGILARLARRLERARLSVGAVADVLGPAEDRVMDAWLGFDTAGAGLCDDERTGHAGPLPRAIRQPDLRAAAVDAAAQLAWQRQLMRAARSSARRRSHQPRPAEHRGVLAAAVRRSRCRVTDGREGLLVIFRRQLPAPWGRKVFSDLVPIFAAGRWPVMRRRGDLQAQAEFAMASVVPAMAGFAPPPSIASDAGLDASDRDALVLARLASRRPVQRGLFDHRAVNEAGIDNAAWPADGVDVAGAGQHAALEPLLLLFVTS